MEPFNPDRPYRPEDEYEALDNTSAPENVQPQNAAQDSQAISQGSQPFVPPVQPAQPAQQPMQQPAQQQYSAPMYPQQQYPQQPAYRPPMNQSQSPQQPAHPMNQYGEAEGILVGGNFSVFCGLAGSDYDFLNRADEGLILFIEDTGESMSKVDRMLHQLEIRGILSKLKGVIVGHFSKYKSPENGFQDMYDMLHEYLQAYDIPVCYDFPVGHHSGSNCPMVEGCRITLTVCNDYTSVRFHSGNKE